MASNVRIQPTALKELEAIVAYLANFGPHTAGAFLDAWSALLNELSDGSVEYGPSRFEVLARLGYRTALLKNYVVLFFKEEDAVVIAHIFHQRQDYARIVVGNPPD